jgi:hypothetical protein
MLLLLSLLQLLMFSNHGSALPRECSLVFPSQNVCAQVQWSAGPFVSDPPSVLQIRFFSLSTQQPVDVSGPVTLDIGMLQMCHAHETPDAIRHPSLGPGVYQAQFVLFMAGEWQIKISLKGVQSSPDTQKFNQTL